MLYFKVKPYNEYHRNKLLTSHNRDRIKAIIDDGVNVPFNDFLTYALFREQKNLPGWQTFKDLKLLLPTRIEHFLQYFNLSGNYIRSVFKRGNDTDNSLIDAMGVGVGLSVISILYNLTEADWSRIPIRQIKDLDFIISSDGKKIIEVETKGSVVEHIDKMFEISGHRARIEKKKKIQRGVGNNSILYGTIAAIPDSDNGIPTCYILDPDGVEIPYDPQVFRIINRLYYYYDLFRIFSRSHFLIALRNRIDEVIKLNTLALNQVPLVNMNGEQYVFPNSLNETHSIIPDYAVGSVQVLKTGQLFFHGVRIDVVKSLLSQDYKNLLEIRYDDKADSELQVNLLARLSYAQARRLGVQIKKEQMPEYGKRYEVRLKALVRCNTAGRVFGWVNSFEL